VIRRLVFELRYLRNSIPWDTGISPPELLKYLAESSPGHALDLGCGTGTNAITLAQHGWQPVGVDLSALAIRTARCKARQAELEIDFRREDVAYLASIEGPFDFALDIGCFHSLGPAGQHNYIQNIARVLKPSGTYLIYTWLADEGDISSKRLTEANISSLFEPYFEIRTFKKGTERRRASAWVQMIRRPE
jgi:cyclopropane fatty-acyl-phospholipid synthase-like methyltransferase